MQCRRTTIVFGLLIEFVSFLLLSLMIWMEESGTHLRYEDETVEHSCVQTPECSRQMHRESGHPTGKGAKYAQSANQIEMLTREYELKWHQEHQETEDARDTGETLRERVPVDGQSPHEPTEGVRNGCHRPGPGQVHVVANEQLSVLFDH